MPVDINKLKADRDRHEQESKRGGDYFNLQAGETLLYVCPPVRDDGLPYVQVVVHFGIGPKNRMAMSLDHGINKIMKDPRVIEALEARAEADPKFTVPDPKKPCPISKEYERLDAAGDKEARDSIKRNNRFMLNVIPIAHRKDSRSEWTDLDADKVMTFMTGTQVWEGITSVFMDEGDISDPDQAVFIKVSKKGTGMTTKYEVKADSDSLKKPVRMSKAQKAAIRAAIEEGGTGDFYTNIANLVVDAPTLERMFAGVDDDEPVDNNSKPECFGKDYEPDDDDDCGKCKWRGACAIKLKVPLGKRHALRKGDIGYEEDEEEEEPKSKRGRARDEEDEPAPKRGRARDEEDEEEEEPKSKRGNGRTSPKDEEEEEPAPKRGSARGRARDEEEEEEEEEEPAPKRRAAPKKDDDEDLDALERALERTAGSKAKR